MDGLSQSSNVPVPKSKAKAKAKAADGVVPKAAGTAAVELQGVPLLDHWSIAQTLRVALFVMLTC